MPIILTYTNTSVIVIYTFIMVYPHKYIYGTMTMIEQSEEEKQGELGR